MYGNGMQQNGMPSGPPPMMQQGAYPQGRVMGQGMGPGGNMNNEPHPPCIFFFMSNEQQTLHKKLLRKLKQRFDSHNGMFRMRIDHPVNLEYKLLELMQGREQMPRDKSDFLPHCVVLIGPRVRFTDGAFRNLKNYMDAGNSIFMLAGKGGEEQLGTNINYFLEEFGVSVNSDSVIRTHPHKLKKGINGSSYLLNIFWVTA